MPKWDAIRSEMDRNDDAARPFRLWNPGDGEFLRWRCYLHLRNAHLGALIECRWAKIGTTIEVIDISTHKQWGSYTRRVNDIHFMGGDYIPKNLA